MEKKENKKLRIFSQFWIPHFWPNQDFCFLYDRPWFSDKILYKNDWNPKEIEAMVKFSIKIFCGF